MRSLIPALIGLATVAVAQNSTVDCVTAYTKCYNFDLSNDNVCSSEASSCKDKCSTQRSNCMSGGSSEIVCNARFDSCIGVDSTSNLASSCLAQVIPCYASASHDLTNACDSKIADCKQACSAILDVCQSGSGSTESCQKNYSACLGSNNATVPSSSCIVQAEQAYINNVADNDAAALTATCKQTCGVLLDACQANGKSQDCEESYEKCLGAGQVTTSDVHCVAEVEAMIQAGNYSDNDIEAHNAQDFCARGNDILSGSGNSADNATALSWYSSCVGAKNLPTLTSSCVSNSEASYLNATSLDNAQDSDLATCKSQCGYMYSTCLSSGDPSVKEGCLAFYSACTSGNSTTSSLNCVAAVEQCYLDGKSDQECDSENAQCKNECTRARSTCGSSGDSSITGQCDSQYESCIGSSKLEPSVVDCVSRTEACYTSGKYTDAECDAQNAICKTTCSRSMDTCTSGSNSTSVHSECLTHYNQCLGSYEVSPISTIDCVKDATTCFLDGNASNNCSASTAVCKTECSRMNDVCLSSGDPSVKPACQKRYENCLGESVEAEEAAQNINCIQRYTDCYDSNIPANQCQMLNADLLDSCGSSSGNASTSSQCQGVYNGCLGSLATSLVNYEPLDCAGRKKTCQSTNATSAECDRQDAECGNACATVLDDCLVSGSSDQSACNHLYMLCLNKDNYKVTSIPASLKPTVSLPSVNTTTKATAALTTAPGSGALSTGGAFVTGPYNNGSSSTANAQSGAVSVATSTESTVYVTDVVKTTVTTCPAGQTITSAGSTTVLTAPSVMTTSVTVKSTVSTTNVHTITVPVGGNNAVPSKTSTSLETTVYVTDVVKSTLTTCPAGQTVTASGKTTVLTAPSVMTTSVTVKSTVSATNVHTITVPAGENNAVPSQTSTSLESTVYVTDVVKSTITTCPAGQTVTASGKTTVLTTPSVMTTSVTVKSTVSTVLTHTAIVPQSSPVSPEQTTPASVEGHVAVPSTVTLYSTKEVTITSCGPEVTSCPARSTQISTTVFPTAITVSSVWSRVSSVPAASSPAGSIPASSVPAGSVPVGSGSAASSPAGSAPAVSSAAGSSPVSPETTSAPVTIPSTMFYYSTAVVTVTSCAEGVQNCPASSTVVKTSVVPTAYSVTSVISSSWTPIEYTSPAAGVPQESAPAVSAPAPIVPTSAPFAVSNSTMMSVGPKGTGIVGTGSGSKATSTYSPSQYTGAANKVGAAGLAGVAAFAAFLL
ncbi:hypothetical protein KCU61_g9450, partial [Aureobasidium melanogenum]